MRQLVVPTLDLGRSTWGCDLPRNRLLDLVVLNAWASWLIFSLGVVSGWLLLGVHGGDAAIGCHHGGHEVPGKPTQVDQVRFA